MASFVIEGGRRMHGELIPQGAKNEALQILCATLLTPETVEVYNLPDILDVNNLIKLLRDLGVETTKIGEGSYRFKAENIDLDYLHTPQFLKQSAALRGSGVMIVGPLVARFGKAVIAKPEERRDRIRTSSSRYALFGNSKTRSRIFLYSPKTNL